MFVERMTFDLSLARGLDYLLYGGLYLRWRVIRPHLYHPRGTAAGEEDRKSTRPRY